ncbi:MAG: Si-specific NAD(P)(+) transhydrogenase [Planctomycetes bacterium]|nr:Si-specific NAD(P)(+) transhydrogenase [Planctomycetota bacterium]
MHSKKYDLIVIGSGPAGQKGAIAAAKLGKSVAIVDRRHLLGGVSLHSGTIPSKTLREAILYLTGFRQRSFYGRDYRLKEKITIGDLNARVHAVIEREMSVIVSQLQRNGVEILHGAAKFVDAHTLRVESDEADPMEYHAEHVLIACGTRPARSAQVECDGRIVLVADQLGGIEALPKELIVVGGGVIGLEYASMFAALGIPVTIIDQRPTILDFADEEIVDSLIVHMRASGATFRLGEKVTEIVRDGTDPVVAHTESGKKIHGDMLLYTVGRQVNTDSLALENVGIKADERGRIAVNKGFQTSVENIYAAGDVIGFPSLASAAMEQGRIAATCMFDEDRCLLLGNMPYGIYTIPEISMVGKNEKDLTEAKIPYESGIARFAEIAKGQMVGDSSGVLKLLFDPKTLKVLGVHVIGESATEIIHIGQAVIALGGTIEYFRDSVFNYPTFAEAYKVAALNGLNRL